MRRNKSPASDNRPGSSDQIINASHPGGAVLDDIKIIPMAGNNLGGQLIHFVFQSSAEKFCPFGRRSLGLLIDAYAPAKTHSYFCRTFLVERVFYGHGDKSQVVADGW